MAAESPLEDVRPARACVTLGPRGRPGLLPASPLDGGRTRGAAGCCCRACCSLTFKGALPDPQSGGEWSPVWLLGFKLPHQNPRLSMAPLPLHNPKAGQSHTGLYFQPGMLNYARVSTHHLLRQRAPFVLAILSLLFIYFWLY